MKNRPPSLAALEQQYDRLRKSLARMGYISQGSVLARSVATSGRSGYQWTRKVAQKTITVSLSQQQFEAMKQAYDAIKPWAATWNPEQEQRSQELARAGLELLARLWSRYEALKRERAVLDFSDLQPGDRLYFAVKYPYDHTGIYIGDGYFIHSSKSRSGVAVSHLSEALFAKSLAAARR